MLIRVASSMFKTAECIAVARRAPLVAAAVAGLLVAGPSRSIGAEKTGASAYNGAAVTVVRAKRSCFAETISVSGMLVPREAVAVRPEREGLQISQVLVDAGDTVTSGQVLARLVPPDTQPNSSQAVQVQSPVAGIVLKVDATIGTTASARAAPMFQVIARGEFELQGELPAKHLSKLSAGQVAKISVAGASEVAGRVRSIAATVNGGTQLGQVNIFIGSDARLRVGAFGRGQIVIAQSCNVAIPLSAVLYSQDTAVVAVVRNDRVETRQVVVGHLADGDAEIREGLAEGDLVVAKAGAFFREGDRVRPFLAGVPAGQK
jgi:multidrug efflux pump subunit AcrA (membrane-fusion protein)